MLNIALNNIITITRGDTASTVFYINIGTVTNPLLYDLKVGDKVYLGVCEPNKPFEFAILKKTFTSADFDYTHHCLVIKFAAEDTEYLLPGTYYYSIKLLRAGATEAENLIDTLVNKTKFIIIE